MSLLVKSHPDKLITSRTLVIGGTSGIGAAVVSAALASGGKVHISSSSQNKITAKIAEFKTLYPKAIVSGTAANLADEQTLEENVKFVLEEATKELGGPIDHLIYTAGGEFEGKSLSDLDPRSYFKGWNVRCLGPLVFAKIITGNPGVYVKVNGASSITLTSGIHAHKPIAGISHFIGWAGAIESIGKALAVDMAPVRVNVVSPGAIHTEMLAKLDETMLQHFADSTLVGRTGAASEAAEAYLFSMKSSYLTGEVIKIHGGAFQA